MNENKSINSLENKLELGKFLESDMVALTEDEVVGGITPALPTISIAISGFISSNTCPSTACTRAC